MTIEKKKTSKSTRNSSQIRKTKTGKKKIKKTLYQELEKYFYPSAIFALMMTVFNYIFMIISLYCQDVGGLFLFVSESVALNIILNSIFNFAFFFIGFLTYTYLLIEMVLLPKK